jgi:hypothetical protein
MSKKSSSGNHDVLIGTPCTDSKWLRDWRREESARRQDADCAVTLRPEQAALAKTLDSPQDGVNDVDGFASGFAAEDTSRL